ncbi:MAG: putative metal-dependent hydrolase [Planctomycetes bacterium]|nr:putative metal-dependent hydrolase [Planctomycetota bacterium]
MDELERQKYPIGRFAMPSSVDAALRRTWIDGIAAQPTAFRNAVAGLSDAQLDTPYRDGGWTLRQVAHHLPDSHLHAYCRTKYALTEDHPTVKPYDEAAWSKLPDALLPVAPSLAIFEHVTTRWLVVLRAMREAEFARTWFHPEQGKTFTLDRLLGLYDWHGRHHLAHITALRQRRGW